jgi:hypothetical protein
MQVGRLWGEVRERCRTRAPGESAKRSRSPVTPLLVVTGSEAADDADVELDLS